MHPTLTHDAAGLWLTSPYHPDAVTRAQQLGGTWDRGRRAWRFAPSQLAAVRQLCRAVYGVDPAGEAPPRVTVRVALDALPHAVVDTGSLYLLGRLLLRRFARDSRVQLGEGVAVVTGGFAPSGGSRQHPRISPLAGTVLQVEDVPRPLAEATAERLPGALTLLAAADPLEPLEAELTRRLQVLPPARQRAWLEARLAEHAAAALRGE